MHASSEVLNIRETCGPFWSGWPKTKWKIIKCSVECTSVDYFECSLGEINYWYENTILLSLSLCLSIRPLCDYFRIFFPGAANTRRQINLGATGWFFRFRTEVFLSAFFPPVVIIHRIFIHCHLFCDVHCRWAHIVRRVSQTFSERAVVESSTHFS